MITITDQGANLFKDSFQRLRPCYDETVKDSIRLVKDNCGGKYGFFSAHASNSFSLAIFFGLLFSNRIRYIILITLVYASFISYSRIYSSGYVLSTILNGYCLTITIVSHPYFIIDDY